MPPVKECPVCIEKLNNSTRKEIICSSCQYSVCRACIETYILNSLDEPSCMNCKKEWNPDYLRDNLTKIFCDTKLKKHREDILYEKEKSLLPATQGYIQILKEKDKISDRITNLWQLRSQIDKQIEDEKKRIRELDKPDAEVSKQKFIRPCPMPVCRGFLSTSYKCGTCNVWVCPDCKEIKGFNRDVEHSCNPEILKSVKAIESDTKPCPNCAVSIYKIDGCFAKDTLIRMQDNTVKKAQHIQINDIVSGHDGNPRNVIMVMDGEDELYEVKQSTGETYTVNSKHKLVLLDSYSRAVLIISPEEYFILDENERTYLRGIRYGAENYPTITINKVGLGKYYGFMVEGNPLILLGDFTVAHNCNQFFCTSCNTVFDWKTGKIVVGGPVHNPHYFEWVRKNGGNVRQIGDEPCGGLPYLFRYTKNIECFKEDYDILLAMYRITAEITDWWRGRYPVTSSLHGNRDLRVNYLLNHISEEEFKKQLQIREKKIVKNTAIRQVFDMFIAVAIENLNVINDAKINNGDVKDNISQLQKIREYTNICLTNIGKKYSCTVPQILENWARVVTV
jgi:hypothetical protein